jgi:hypothetical protein
VRTGRVLALVISTALLLGTGFIGLYNGITEWGDAVSLSERAVTGGVFLYGLLGLVSGVGVVLKRAWSYKVALLWGAVVTAVAGGAVCVYGGGSAGAVAAAAIATLAIAALTVWLGRYSLVAKRD